jgi:hypothetical protein
MQLYILRQYVFYTVFFAQAFLSFQAPTPSQLVQSEEVEVKGIFNGEL